MKMLYILNTTSRVNNFSYSSIIAAQKLGIEFHIAGNWTGYSNPADKKADEMKYGIRIHQIDFIRTPYDPRNINAYRQVVELIKREKFDVIHCNTPIGGVIGRLAGKKSGVKKIIYEAHGFHFFNGAPKINWIIYYPIEKWLAHYTDCIVTMNAEDNEIAKKFKLRNEGKVYNVHGVGIDLSEFKGLEQYRERKRKEFGFTEENVVLISMGDLIARKNYKVAIEAIAKCNNPRLHYIICGKGPEFNNLKALVKAKCVEKQVHFLGFRSDIKELLAAADIFIQTSLQEGLPRSMMEAMATGLPCIASRIRGNVDLIENGKGGYLCNAQDINSFANAVSRLVKDSILRSKMAKINSTSIGNYGTKVVENEMFKIYKVELK